MAAVTHSNGSKLMSDDEGPDERPSLSAGSNKGGFFTVYKKGQGYYTRLGTALCAILLVVLLCSFIYQQVSTQFSGSFYTPQILPANASVEETVRINELNTAGVQSSAKTARELAIGLTVVLGGLGAAFAWKIFNQPRTSIS